MDSGDYMSTQGPSQSQGGSLPPKPNPTASPPVNINQDLYSGRNPQTPQVKPAPASSTVSPMPPQPGSKEYNTQGNWVNAGQVVAKNTVPITTHDPTTPQVKTVVGTREIETLGPVVKNYSEPSGLDLAKQQNQNQINYQVRSGSQQGTSAPGLSQPQITQGLSPSDKATYKEDIVNSRNIRLTNLGLLLGAGAVAPVLGPVGATEAALSGVGFGQGIKTGATILEGGNWKNSLLTPQEAINYGETGIIFAGVFKGAVPAVRAASPFGAKLVGSSFGRFGVKTLSGFTVGEGLEAAQTGKLSAIGAVENLGFSAGFAGVDEFGGALRSRLPTRLGGSDKSTVFKPYKGDVATYGKGSIKDLPIVAKDQIIANNDIGNKEGIVASPKNKDVYVANISSNKPQFINGLDDLAPLTPKMGNYLVKMPEGGNLDMFKGIKITGRNQINVNDANTKLNAQLSNDPSTNQYDFFPASKDAKNNTLFNIERLLTEPQTHVTESTENPLAVEAKINQYNFDAEKVDTQISKVVKQKDNYFDADEVNSKITATLKEAEAEKATNNIFTTDLIPKQSLIPKTPDSMVKMPEYTNLDLSKTIKISNRNFIDVDEANERINSLKNEVPSKSSYSDYKTVISQGKTTTKNRDSSLFNVERLLKEQTDISIPKSKTTSFSPINVPNHSNMRLIAKVGTSGQQNRANSHLRNQLTGGGEEAMYYLGNRVAPLDTLMVNQKINTQLQGPQIIVKQSQSSQLTNTLSQALGEDIVPSQKINTDQSLGVFSGVNTSLTEGQDTFQDVATIIGSNVTLKIAQFNADDLKLKNLIAPKLLKYKGVKSRKRVYPILSGEDVLRL